MATINEARVDKTSAGHRISKRKLANPMQAPPDLGYPNKSMLFDRVSPLVNLVHPSWSTSMKVPTPSSSAASEVVIDKADSDTSICSEHSSASSEESISYCSSSCSSLSCSPPPSNSTSSCHSATEASSDGTANYLSKVQTGEQNNINSHLQAHKLSRASSSSSTNSSVPSIIDPLYHFQAPDEPAEISPNSLLPRNTAPRPNDPNYIPPGTRGHCVSITWKDLQREKLEMIERQQAQRCDLVMVANTVKAPNAVTAYGTARVRRSIRGYPSFVRKDKESGRSGSDDRSTASPNIVTASLPPLAGVRAASRSYFSKKTRSSAPSPASSRAPMILTTSSSHLIESSLPSSTESDIRVGAGTSHNSEESTSSVSASEESSALDEEDDEEDSDEPYRPPPSQKRKKGPGAGAGKTARSVSKRGSATPRMAVALGIGNEPSPLSVPSSSTASSASSVIPSSKKRNFSTISSSSEECSPIPTRPIRKIRLTNRASSYIGPTSSFAEPVIVAATATASHIPAPIMILRRQSQIVDSTPKAHSPLSQSFFASPPVGYQHQQHHQSYQNYQKVSISAS